MSVDENDIEKSQPPRKRRSIVKTLIKILLPIIVKTLAGPILVLDVTEHLAFVQYPPLPGGMAVPTSHGAAG